MIFFKSPTKIDLGDTPIENIFIDVYMPMANGTYVKVYLLGYKYACDRDTSNKIDHKSLAKNLNIPLSDVYAAWDFWESKKIIKKVPLSEEDQDSEYNYSIEFLNLKQLYIDNNFRPNHAPKEEKENIDYSCSTKDIIEANHIPQIREMFNEINKIIMRSLVPNEKMQILEWLQKYNIDPPLIIKAFSYCWHKKKKRSVQYAGGILRNWYDKGLTSVDELQEYLLKQGERYGLYDRVFKAMGFSNRPGGPSEAEKAKMDAWVDEFKFSHDMILKACENCSKTSNPNINYIHSILERWYKNNITSLEDVEKESNLAAIKKPTNPQPKSTVPQAKTKFHLANSRGDKYSAEELEKLVLNNQKKK
ncbi:DnaD domain protein [Serpentinicella sp. ANB-PHB4]|uniref:DnaD domain-containing protein n=1 Tax=Serpentinicella sp. ANB-PHB4 TaxID=3074076 RepID=UPI00285631A5|nr:DnaD domain protein [Serpentinicella sp. ANB-PHB4]MDR5658875.1 DnaD domain protein [Serpentinicella sp. ANB-PHB4]